MNPYLVPRNPRQIAYDAPPRTVDRKDGRMAQIAMGRPVGQQRTQPSAEVPGAGERILRVEVPTAPQISIDSTRGGDLGPDREEVHPPQRMPLAFGRKCLTHSLRPNIWSDSPAGEESAS
jgi:hypothetical protein